MMKLPQATRCVSWEQTYVASQMLGIIADGYTDVVGVTFIRISAAVLSVAVGVESCAFAYPSVVCSGP